MPIWRIDDGPVHGIPWDLCQGAQRHSDNLVAKGFEPSWPGLVCANVSYAGPERSYCQAVTLTQGAHTLFAGTLVKVHMSVASFLCSLCAVSYTHLTLPTKA